MDEILNIDHHRRILILKALNKAPTYKQAAKLLGISERHIYRWIDQYGIVQVDGTYMTREQNKSINPQYEHVL